MDCSPQVLYVQVSSSRYRVGSFFLLQGIFPTSIDLGFPYCRRILYCLNHLNSSNKSGHFIPYLKLGFPSSSFFKTLFWKKGSGKLLRVSSWVPINPGKGMVESWLLQIKSRLWARGLYEWAPLISWVFLEQECCSGLPFSSQDLRWVRI